MEINKNPEKIIDFVTWLIIHLFLVFIIFAIQLFSSYNSIYTKSLSPDYFLLVIGPILSYTYLLYVLVQLFGIFKIIGLKLFAMYMVPIVFLLTFIDKYVLDHNLFNFCPEGILNFLSFSILLLGIIHNVLLYKREKNFGYLIPGFFGIILFVSCVWMARMDSNRFSEKQYLNAYSEFIGNKVEKNQIELFLSENGNVVLSEISNDQAIISFDYGNFEIENGAICLQNIKNSNLKSNFLKRKIITTSKGKKEVRLVQVDKNGEEIKNSIRFRIGKNPEAILSIN